MTEQREMVDFKAVSTKASASSVRGPGVGMAFHGSPESL